jgi:hypothetical protein
MYRLSDEDSRAVDLLLDSSEAGNGNGNGNGHGAGNAFQAATSTNFTQRLERAEQLLDVIGQMPAAEPPVNLVARTLQAVESGHLGRTSAPTVTARPASPQPRGNRPHA